MSARDSGFLIQWNIERIFIFMSIIYLNSLLTVEFDIIYVCYMILQ